MHWCVATRLGEKSPTLSPRATDTDRTADAVEKAASRSWRPGIGRKHGFDLYAGFKKRWETAEMLLQLVDKVTPPMTCWRHDSFLDPKHFYILVLLLILQTQTLGYVKSKVDQLNSIQAFPDWTWRQVVFALEFSSTFATFAELRAGCKIKPAVPRFWQEKWCFGSWLCLCQASLPLSKTEGVPSNTGEVQTLELKLFLRVQKRNYPVLKVLILEFLSPPIRPVKWNFPSKENVQILFVWGDNVKCHYLVFGIVLPKARFLQLKYCN